MTSFYYYDQNPSGFCFLVLIRASVIQTSPGLQNLNMKEKRKGFWPVKWRHRANGLLSCFTLVCLWCGRTEGGKRVRSRDYQNFSDGLPNFSRYRALACACPSRERGASLSLKQEVVLDFYKAFYNRLLTLLVRPYTPNSRFPYPSMYLYRWNPYPFMY